MSVGDVNSGARGSGARFNTGKPMVEYIPAGVLAQMYSLRFAEDSGSDPLFFERRQAIAALHYLSDFEAGDDKAPLHALGMLSDRWALASAQFDFGAKKYAAWNWAKGMQWSVPGACIKRHCIAILDRYERDDQESGVPHTGAIACNFVMLAHFIDHYREGDDRPPPACFGDREKEGL